ncbi:MAG TPA: hypothetical protein VF950_15790 [Planctomycetota bacterium]
MVNLSRAVLTLALVGLFCGPLAADVIPVRYASDSGSKKAVESKLAASGVDAQMAHARAQRLTEEEAAFFAADARRCQVVGQEMWGGQSDNLWWEWLGGLGFLAITAAGIAIFAVSND